MNDERPIEELLRRAAQERRAAAGEALELSPLHRRLLQAEVARRFPATAAPRPADHPPFWRLPIWRWGYVLAAFAGIAITGVWLFFQSGKTTLQPAYELAKRLPGEASRPVLTTPPPPSTSSPWPPAASPVSDEETKTAAPAVTVPVARRIPVAPEPHPTTSRQTRAAARSQGTSVPTGTIAVSRTDEALSAPRSAAPPPAALTNEASIPVLPSSRVDAAPRIRLADAGPREPADAGTSLTVPAPLAAPRPARADAAVPAEVRAQSFVRFVTAQQEKVRDERLPQLAVPHVLQSFKVEQRGLNLRVVDSDGSVYRGMFDEANTIYGQISARRTHDLGVAQRNRFRLPSPQARADTTRARRPIYFYQVSGTNQTRNAGLTFSWNFISTNATTLSAAPDYRPAIQDPDFSKRGSDFSEALHRSYLRGQVQWSDGRVIEINAAPVFSP